MSNQQSQLLLAVSITAIVLSCVAIVIAVYENAWPIVQFAFAVLSIALAVSVQLSSHDETVKRAILVTCGLLAPMWFIIAGILRLSG